MPFDATSYLRLDAPHCLGSSKGATTFSTSTGDILEVSSFGPGAFRLRAGPHTRADYGILAGRAEACEVTQEDGVWRFASGEAILEVRGVPLTIRLLRGSAVLATSITDEHVRGGTRLPAFGRVRHGGQWIAAFALPSAAAVYGLGEKFGRLDKRGQLLHSWVQDALGVNTGLAYHEVPFAWSTVADKGAWGVLVHTPGAVIHGVGHPDWSHRSYVLVVDDEALDLLLFAAAAPAGVLERYADLTGRPTGVPLWSLGLTVARPGEDGVREAAQTARHLRERRIPCDAIALDTRALWRPEVRFDFSLDTSHLPDAADALAAIKRHDVRVCVCESPYVSVHSPLFDTFASHGHLLRTAHGGPYVFNGAFLPANAWSADAPGCAPDCALVDFTHPAAFAAWRDAHGELFAAGIDAIHADGGGHVPEDALASNGDRGARLHNAYPLLYARCVAEATAKFHTPAGTPPVAFAHAGWTSSQRTPVHAGDHAQNDWEALAASIRGALSLGMSGVPLCAMAVGGTYGSAPPDAELALRWLQAGVFASHVVVRGAAGREPWAFGAQAEGVARKWLGFRYRLLPYLQRAIGRAIRSGLPVMQAMPLAFPTNALVRGYETQYLVGDALLIAPILQPGGEVEVALPPGAWFDLNSRQRIGGARVVRYRAALDQFPVFGREGYALPLGPGVQHTGEIDPARPLAQLWLFGKPAQVLDGFAQATIVRQASGALTVHAQGDLRVERFGDAAEVTVESLS